MVTVRSVDVDCNRKSQRVGRFVVFLLKSEYGLRYNRGEGWMGDIAYQNKDIASKITAGKKHAKRCKNGLCKTWKYKCKVIDKAGIEKYTDIQ